MRFTIATSKSVADKIVAMQQDKVLKNKNIEIISVSPLYSDKNDTYIVDVSWKGDDLQDIFFFGYWTNSIDINKLL